MALWDALAPAATVAQLVGVDAAGLVSATLQAVRTARRNHKECHALARRVMMVGDLLQLVRQGSSETMRRPEVGRALDGLGGALRRAYELVASCQARGAVYGLVMARRQAEQFRDVQAEIDGYLLVFPMVSHIDITIRLDRIYNMLIPPDSSQQERRSCLWDFSFGKQSNCNIDFRGCGRPWTRSSGMFGGALKQRPEIEMALLVASAEHNRAFSL